METQRIIITGAPGTGKSTLLAALRAAGWAGCDEVSREVIRGQIAKGGRCTPWQDLSRFARICEDRMRVDWHGAVSGEITFYDRGLPDVVAYLRHGSEVVAPLSECGEEKYFSQVIYAPLWQEIFVSDEERPQSWDDAVGLDRELRAVYQEMGYELHELPQSDVSSRVSWVESAVLSWRKEVCAWPA